MCWKRRAGSLRKQCWISRSSSRGTAGTRSLGGRGSSFRIAASVETVDSREKARRPVTIS